MAGLLAQDRCAEIELARLSQAETVGLAERLTGGAVTGAAAQRLFDETEGNPLFVVEALRAGWTPRRSLSPRVQAVIQMRLAQLSPAARDLVGLAATIGREFSTDVLAAAAGQDGDLLVRGLDELWRRRIVREQSADTYDFSHDKIRQVAYADVTPARRRGLHLRIANALETVGGTGSAQIAAHYDRAGAGGLAIGWYRRAAEEAQLLHANAQAVHLLGRSLALLRSLPGFPERDATELAVQTALLAPLFAVQGYATSAVLAAQQRARELTRTLGADPTPPLLRSLALASLTRSDFAATTQFGQSLLAAGERDGDDVLIVEAGYVLGVAAFWQADFNAARRHFELSVERYRPEERRVHLIRYGQDPKVVCLSRLANTLWFLGRRAEARAARAGALAWAAEIVHPYSIAVARTFGALLALDMGDEREVRAHTKALIGADPGPLQVQLPLAAFIGYLAVLDGDDTGGVAAIRVAVQRARGDDAAPGVQAITARILLAACVAGGTAGSVLAAAQDLTDLGGAARIWQPEVLRVRAQFAPERR
jgi:hypothetical protein